VIATTPIWRDVATLDEEPGPIPRRADVVIVGGGIIGLAAMHELVAHDATAVLIEAGRPGGGATSTGPGVVGWAPSLAHPDDIDPRASGFTEIAETLEQAGDWLAEHLANHDLDASIATPGDVSVLGPADPGPLSTIDPDRLTAALVEAIRSYGGSIATNEALRSLSKHTAGFQVLTSKRKITADEVIIATGAAAGPRPLGELHKRYRHRRGRCLVVTTTRADVDRLVPPGTSYRPAPDLTVIRRLSSEAVLVWYPDLGPRRFTMEPELLLAGSDPRLAGARITHDWQDRYATTGDGIPRIGRIRSAWYAGGAADLALGALLGHHVAGLTIGSLGSSPFAEIPHERDLTSRIRTRLINRRWDAPVSG
jgi:glycine/D-amino acid oxidase-like deaminating enzyme